MVHVVFEGFAVDSAFLQGLAEINNIQFSDFPDIDPREETRYSAAEALIISQIGRREARQFLASESFDESGDEELNGLGFDPMGGIESVLIDLFVDSLQAIEGPFIGGDWRPGLLGKDSIPLAVLSDVDEEPIREGLVLLTYETEPFEVFETFPADPAFLFRTDAPLHRSTPFEQGEEI
jgi:hypothetical protein